MEPRIKTVVVPLDGSKAAEQALPLAAALANVFGACLDVVHVVDDLRAAVSDVEMEARRQPFLAYVADLAAAGHLPQGHWQARVELGIPAKTILQSAESTDESAERSEPPGRSSSAQAIVIASHGRGGAYATFMGSVADKVVRSATIPVLVVPAVGRWVNLPKTILVPLDGSEASEGALALARTIGQALGATLVLLRAVDLYPMPVMEFGYWPADLPQELEKTATGYLATLKAPGERVLAVPGEASIVIARVAAEVDADLVIMSASGKGLASRLVLGSTTDRVLHSLHRPLLIVPKAEERAVQDQDTKEGTR